MAASSNQPETISLRVGAEALQACIERMEAAPQRFYGLEQRRSRRFAYRVTSLVLELLRDQSVTSRIVVAARNLSENGIGIVAQQFIYPQQACRLELTPVTGRPQTVSGIVMRCRYLPGQNGLHEVGIQFRTPIDVGLFIPEARPVRVLLVDPNPQTHLLVDEFLGDNVELSCATSAADAGAAALSHEFDLMLVDLDAAAIDAFALMRELRRAGYLGAVVGLAVDGGPELQQRCADAGCTGYLTRPVTRESLHGLLESLRAEPLQSTLPRNPELAALINTFVASAREHARTLVAALENADLATIRRVARELRVSGGSFGFPSISAEATLVETQAALNPNDRELRESVAELVHLCLIARGAPHAGGTAWGG